MTDHRNKWFDIFKGMAILGVVAVHYAQQFSFEIYSGLKSVFISGQYMVQMFFIISGYFAFYSISEHGDCGVSFLLRKLLSLLPVCYVAYLIRIFYFAASGHRIAFFDVVCAFTFTNGVSPHYINSIGGWYVGTLVLFFAIVPILHKIVTTKYRSVVLFIISLLVSFVSNAVISRFFDTGWVFYFWLPRQFPVLVLGIVLYYFEKDSYGVNGEVELCKNNGGG